MKIMKSTVDAARYAGGTDYRWDDSLKGFGLRVYPSGRKSFVVSYRIHGRKKIKILGALGVLTPDEARKRAKKILAASINDEDPLAEKAKARRGATVRQLADRYMDEHAIPKKKPRSVKEDRRLLDKFVLPALGSRMVQEVDREDVGRLHHSLREIPYQANRVLALTSKMMSLAEKWGLREDNTNP